MSFTAQCNNVSLNPRVQLAQIIAYFKVIRVVDRHLVIEISIFCIGKCAQNVNVYRHACH